MNLTVSDHGLRVRTSNLLERALLIKLTGNYPVVYMMKDDLIVYEWYTGYKTSKIIEDLQGMLNNG